MARIINITRNRDTYDITVVTDGRPEKHAYYNIATNEKIGISGKVVQALRYEEGILLNILMGYYLNPKVREFCDRLISLPTFDYNKKNYICQHSVSYYDIQHDMDVILNNWKDFLEYAKADEITTDFVSYLSNKKAASALDWIQDAEIKDMVKHMYNSARMAFIEMSQKYKSFRKAVNQEIKRKIKIDNNRKKLFEMLQIDKDTLSAEYGMKCFNILNSISQTISFLIDDYERADALITKLQLTNYEINDVKDALRDLKSMEESRENEIFANHQKNAHLEYENNEFKIFVPTSRGDLAQYGNYFHNCLNGHEWNCYLSCGERYAVIVIDKATNQPVICVDIECDNRRIHQYLKPCNRPLSKDDDRYRAFKTEYQQYLQKVNN